MTTITATRTKPARNFPSRGIEKFVWTAKYSGGAYIEIFVNNQPVDVINVYNYKLGMSTLNNPTRGDIGKRLAKWLSDNHDDLSNYVEQAHYQNR